MRAVVMMLVLAAAAPASAATDRQTRVLALAAGATLSVDITIGHLRVEGSNRADVEVVIERTAPTTEALARVSAAVEQTPAGVTVRAVQADGGSDPAFRADVTLRVPAAAVIDRARVMEGRVTITAFHGSITADIRRGPIEATDISGTVRLEAGIGSVNLERARLSPTGLLRLRAFNGDVRLHLAARPADARILALALNGSIASDIPLATKNTWGPRWSEATLGKGEPVISIDVVTGQIAIRSP